MGMAFTNEISNKIATINLDTHLKAKYNEYIVKYSWKHENKKTTYSVTEQAKDYLSEFQLQEIPEVDAQEASTGKAKHLKIRAKSASRGTLTDKWQNDLSITRPDFDKAISH